MRVVDTSAWIEWLADSDVGARVASLLPDDDQWLVPTIVQMELAKWLGRTLGERATDRIIAASAVGIVVPLDTRIALLAAEVASQHKLATADAVIYATALVCRADLLTCDRHFEGLSQVVLIPKL